MPLRMVCEAMVATARKPAQSGLAPVKTFDSLNPATDEPVGTFPIFGEDEVNETVAKAREAAAWWSALSWTSARPSCWPGSRT